MFATRTHPPAHLRINGFEGVPVQLSSLCRRVSLVSSLESVAADISAANQSSSSIQPVSVFALLTTDAPYIAVANPVHHTNPTRAVQPSQLHTNHIEFPESCDQPTPPRTTAEAAIYPPRDSYQECGHISCPPRWSAYRARPPQQPRSRIHPSCIQQHQAHVPVMAKQRYVS